LSASLINVNIA